MITIMGASGRVGGAVLEVVSQTGQPVRALSRNPPAETRPNVEWRAVEARDSAALAAAFAPVLQGRSTGQCTCQDKGRSAKSPGKSSFP